MIRMSADRFIHHALAAQIDTRFQSIVFCELKEPNQLPDNARHGQQYGRKVTRPVYMRYEFIIQIIHFSFVRLGEDLAASGSGCRYDWTPNSVLL